MNLWRVYFWNGSVTEFKSVAAPTIAFNGVVGPIMDVLGCWHLFPVESLTEIVVEPVQEPPSR